jgi:transposase-like protein
LLRELTERARAGGLKLTGGGGLLGKLTKMVIEGALEGELDDHLGYGKHDPDGRNGRNSRNGHRGKTVLTEAGPAEISVPRDRDSSFEPRIVLGLWAGEHGDGEGAKYWLRVLAEIKNRGARDVGMLVCDGLKGLPDEVGAVREYLAIMSLDPTGRGRQRWTNRWKAALNAFDIT